VSTPRRRGVVVNGGSQPTAAARAWAWSIGHDGRARLRAGHTGRRLSAQAGQRARALRRARKQIWISVPSARTRLSRILATCVHSPDWTTLTNRNPSGRFRLRWALRGLARAVHEKPSILGLRLCVRHRHGVNFVMVTFLSRAHSSSQSLHVVSMDTLPPTILLDATCRTDSCISKHVDSPRRCIVATVTERRQWPVLIVPRLVLTGSRTRWTTAVEFLLILSLRVVQGTLPSCLEIQISVRQGASSKIVGGKVSIDTRDCDEECA
jgi:hypothetical protein